MTVSFIAEQFVIGVLTMILIGMLLCPFSIEEYNKEIGLGKSNMNYARGIACVMVVICHASSINGAQGILMIPFNMGLLPDGIFFFCSGYGLMYSYINKKNYLKGFLVKRVMPIYIPLVLSNILYIIAGIFMEDEKLDAVIIAKRILGIDLVCASEWFVRVLILFYILFYISGTICKSPKIFVITLTICIIVYRFVTIQHENALAIVISHVFPFIIGIWCAYFDFSKLEYYVKKHYRKILIIFALITILSFGYISVIRWHLPITWTESKIMNDIAGTIYQNVFVIMVIMISMRLRIKSRVAAFIGAISYDIYLMHQLVINISQRFFAQYSLIIALVSSLLLSILVAIVFNKVELKVTSLILLRTKKIK